MDDNDRIVIRRLTESYRRRIQWYSALNDIGQRILGRLVLSRGDFSGVGQDFAEKQLLLDKIEQERAETSGEVEIWSMRKNTMTNDPEAGELDRVLADTQTALSRFLDTEAQLKHYIGRMLKPVRPAAEECR